MRVLIFFDLPTLTPENRRNYNKFHRQLIKNGFIMLQESVYCRMLLNQTAVNIAINNIKKIKPPDGLVQILTVTEKQFSKMEFVTGEHTSDVIENDERLIII